MPDPEDLTPLPSKRLLAWISHKACRFKPRPLRKNAVILSSSNEDERRISTDLNVQTVRSLRSFASLERSRPTFSFARRGRVSACSVVESLFLRASRRSLRLCVISPVPAFSSRAYLGVWYSPSISQDSASPAGAQVYVPLPLMPFSLPVPPLNPQVPFSSAGAPSLYVAVP